MEANELIIRSFDNRRRKFRLELNRARANFSEEAVHDLRVATRRLLALLDLARTLDANLTVARLRRDLKDQLDSLDPLRDTQVMLKEVTSRLPDLPSLAPFCEDLTSREVKLLADTREALGKVSFAQLSQLNGRLTSLRTRLAGTPDLADPLEAVDVAYRKVTRRAGVVESSWPASFHRMRVAFKRFRYGVEIVRPLLGGYPKSNLGAMDDYQTGLGRIQDSVVLLAALDDFSSENGAFDPAPVYSHYERVREEAIEAFLAEKDRLGHFWRAEPRQEFPWESNS